MHTVYLDELDFHEILAHIYAVWRTESHCLRFGCGRETLARWVHHVTGAWLPAWAYRRALVWCVGLGIASYRRDGYSCFEFVDDARLGAYRLSDTMAVGSKIHQMRWGFVDESQWVAALSAIPVGEYVVPMPVDIDASVGEIGVAELHFRRHDVYKNIWQRVA